MATTPKGWPSQAKESQTGPQEFSTVSPVGPYKHALDVIDRSTVSVVVADLAETGSTTKSIAATAHSALKGDRIRFTSGNLIGQEVEVLSVDTDVINLAFFLSEAPAASDGFDILRPTSLTVAADGGISTSPGPVQFVLDGVDTEVNEDTVTPANNAPLPVKLTGVTGDVNITAGDLNVQLSHTGASFDSTRIGDGTNLMAVNASLEAQVRDDDAITELQSIVTNTGSISNLDVALSTRASETTLGTRASETTLSTLNAKFVDGTVIGDVNAIQSGTWNINNIGGTITLPTGAATAALQTAGNADLATLAGTVASGQVQVDVVAPLPTGGNMIGSVDAFQQGAWNITNISGTVSLPTGASTAALQTAGNADLSTLAGTVSGSEIQADIVGPLPAGSNTIGAVTIAALDVVETVYNDNSSSNIPGNASLPLQLIASTSAQVRKIQVADTGGAFYELMSGAAASEVREALIGPGSDQTLEIDLAAATRLSIRRVDDAAALSAGSLALNLIG